MVVALIGGRLDTLIQHLGSSIVHEPGLRPQSDQTLRLDNVSLQAARGAFVTAPPGFSPADPDGLSMIVLQDVSNVTIVGGEVRMWKSDYNSLPQYNPPSSTRMGIVLRNCSDIAVSGVTIVSTGGDGIYIGRNHKGDQTSS